MQRILVLCLIAGCGASAAMADSTQRCTIGADQSDSKMRFGWQRSDCVGTGSCNGSDFTMPWSRWTGVTPIDLEHEGATVDARMRAEAGEMRCVGVVSGSSVHGTYSFTANAAFATHMEALGFDDQSPERLQSDAMLDVTTVWAKKMKDDGVQGMTSDKLLGLRVFGVDETYLRGMAAAGYPELRADTLMNMKAVGVSPEKVQQIRALGYSPTEEELIQMSVLKIDAPFVERMKARGFSSPTIAQLVRIKMFKLDE